MLRIYGCLTTQHDARLVILAGSVCLLACLITTFLLPRASEVVQRRNLALLSTIAAAVFGGGIWTTHFLAELAYRPGLPVGYDVSLTILSLVIAISITWLGMVAALRFSNPLLGGFLLAAAISGMHYVGMAALEVPADFTWDIRYVLASLAAGGILTSAALHVRSLGARQIYRLTSALLLVGAICGVHFIGMAAVTLLPDSAITIPDRVIAPNLLAITVAAVIVLGIFLCVAAVLYQTYRHNRQLEASEEQLMLQNAELQGSRRTLEKQAAAMAEVMEALKLSEQRLAHESRALEVTLEYMDQGIMMVDADHRIAVHNPRLAELMEVPEALLGGHPKIDEVPAFLWENDSSDKRHEDPGAPTTDGGQVEKALVYERRRPNGRTVEIRSIPLPGGGGVRTYTDISVRTAIEEQLAEARDQAEAARQRAEAASEAKSQFLAMMSHEIRSPMNGVIGIIDLLRRTELSLDQRQMVELVHSSASSLLHVINDILDFSKIEAGAIDIAAEPCELPAFIIQLRESVAHSASEKGLQFETRISDRIPRWIVVDAHRLRQILINLLSNAIKFTISGSVQLIVEPVETDPSRATFAVLDTGIGMEPEAMNRLFDPFTQADASTTRNFGGTGLGLSISRKLAKLLGGDIRVSSEHGWGSVFTLELPIVPATPVPSVATEFEEAIGHVRFLGLRALVAEDLSTNRWEIKRQLEHLGLTVEVTEDGHAAMAAFMRSRFDLLITDFHMPGMDGIELSSHIRAVEAAMDRPRMPIMALTADITDTVHARCRNAGIDEVILKPATLPSLDAALRSLLLGTDGNLDVPQVSLGATPTGWIDGAEPVFTRATLDEIFVDQPAEGKQWLDGFLHAGRDIVGCLSETIAPDAARSAAHRLAGIALTVGATQLGVRARRLEAVCDTADHADYRSSLAQTLTSWRTTEQEIQGLIDTMEGISG